MQNEVNILKMCAINKQIFKCYRFYRDGDLRCAFDENYYFCCSRFHFIIPKRN